MLTAVFERDDDGYWLVELKRNPGSTRTGARSPKPASTSSMPAPWALGNKMNVP